jgi:selenide,water dikinase
MAALKRQTKTEEQLQEALQSMMQLNRTSDLWEKKEQAQNIHAATDVTGFGLLGHAQQLARASHVRLRIWGPRIPLFQLTRECLAAGFLTKAHRTNAQYTEGQVQDRWGDPIGRLAMVDPQTSGGLLLSVGALEAESVLRDLRRRFPLAEIIGEVLAGDGDLPLIEISAK